MRLIFYNLHLNWVIGFQGHKRLTYLSMARGLRGFYGFTLICEFPSNLCHQCSIWK